MLKTIIIEDEPTAANLLEKMLQEVPVEVSVVEKCADLPSGVKSIKRHNPDFVFLDIELPIYSGIQLLDFFNPEEITFQIIFTTAYNEFAIKAFEMSAVDYLLKPLQEDKLTAAVRKADLRQGLTSLELMPALRQNLQHNPLKKLVVPVSSGSEILNPNDICYFKAEGSYTNVFFAAKTNFVVSKNLKHFEFILSGNNQFIRIHRSYIANIDFAKKILRKDGAFLVMENGVELPITEDKLNKIITEFHGRQ